MVVFEDHAHAQMVASMSVVQMAEEWLLYDLIAAYSFGLLISKACIFLSQAGLYSTKDTQLS
jgi:hypothetical protein